MFRFGMWINESNNFTLVNVSNFQRIDLIEDKCSCVSVELILNDDHRSACEPSLLCSKNETSSSLELVDVVVVVVDEDVISI